MLTHSNAALGIPSDATWKHLGHAFAKEKAGTGSGAKGALVSRILRSSTQDRIFDPSFVDGLGLFGTVWDEIAGKMPIWDPRSAFYGGKFFFPALDLAA